ncbi:MAG: hypothetical protein EBV06_16330 [Planctomycetia bacterium]|nr:hypothetical protein [Planctomycetia bacterium]
MLVSSMLMCTKRLCAGRKDAKKLAHCQQANASNDTLTAYGNYIGYRQNRPSGPRLMKKTLKLGRALGPVYRVTLL